MGLVGPLTHSNAEWHSALQTQSRDGEWDQRDCLSQLPVREWGPSLNVQGTRIWNPGQPETLLFVSSPYSSDSFSFIRFEGGVCWETRGGDTPPAPSHMAIGTPPPEKKTEPVQGTRLRDVHGHKAKGVSVGVIINW